MIITKFKTVLTGEVGKELHLGRRDAEGFQSVFSAFFFPLKLSGGYKEFIV